MKPTPHSFLALKFWEAIDRQFARLVERLSGETNPGLALAAAVVSRQLRQGHSCVCLPALAGTRFPPEAAEGTESLRLPEVSSWLADVRRAGAVVGAPGEFKPLLLDDQSRLYLHRYWDYEKTVMVQFQARLAGTAATPSAPGPDPARVRTALARLFPPPPPGQTDWQKVAVVAALLHRFCVITGGPGTGKTHTVVKLLALLMELAADQPLKIALAAPTGKAAARLTESLGRARESLAGPPEFPSRLPAEACTLHRLLGALPGSPYFRHHADHPLPHDVVVVDEASMVDLPLMAKLLLALRPNTRLILLGDQDQLASVEPGSVLGDLCAAPGAGEFSAAFGRAYCQLTGESLPPDMIQSAPVVSPLRDHIIQLRENYRFGTDSPIFRLSQAINHGDPDEALAVLDSDLGPAPVVKRWDLPAQPAALKAGLRPAVLQYYGPMLQETDPASALAALTQFRILCALREGPAGVAGLNRLVEAILAEAGRIPARLGDSPYPGQPLLVTVNDYQLGLFNGDIGVVLSDPATGQLRAFFSGPEAQPRSFPLPLLPPHETVFAMTVHKSQGSEFDRVLLLLPDQPNPILTRELVYTGLTRAKQAVELWANETVLRTAIQSRVQRVSGLNAALAR